MRRLVQVILAIVLTAILVSSLAAAKQSGQVVKAGTAADFAMMFPWVVVGLVVLLFSIIAWFIKRYDEQREKKIDQAIDEIGSTNKALATATTKLDATINTLFERDRDLERVLAAHGADIAAIKATCAARGKMCRLLDGKKIVCLDRRDGDDRRTEEDRGKDPP